MNSSALPGFILVDSGEFRKTAADEQVVEKIADPYFPPRLWQKMVI